MLQGQKTGSEYIIFLYDENNSPYAMIIKNGTTESTYYYQKNLQGDIVSLLDSNGNRIAYYYYDSGGSLITTECQNQTNYAIANKNPLRYRGYYYDTESYLYYLNSRYYNPVLYRFISADSQISGVGSDIRGYNLYAYCFNDPVNMDDQSGNWPKWATKLVAAVAVVAVVAVVATVCVATFGAGSVVAAVAVGAAKGAAIGFATGAVTGAAGGAINHRITTGSWDGAGEAALNGMADGALSGSVTGAISGGITGGLSHNPTTSAQTPTSSPTNTSRGSTGRIESANLREQLAMEQVKSNPSAGTPLTRITLNDPRWPSSEGWVKMQQIVPTSKGNINIHYVYNQTLNKKHRGRFSRNTGDGSLC